MDGRELNARADLVADDSTSNDEIVFFEDNDFRVTKYQANYDVRHRDLNIYRLNIRRKGYWEPHQTRRQKDKLGLAGSVFNMFG